MSTTVTAADEQNLTVANLPPSRAQKRAAVVVVLGVFVIFVAITVGALEGLHPRRSDSFMTAYLSAMFVCDSITAILLFAQFSIVRLRPILVMANAYLFTALVLIPYGLTFPGVLAPLPPIGSVQSAAYLFILWHCGFPLFVIVYVLSKDGPPNKLIWGSTPRAAIARSVALTVALVFAGAIPAITGGESLPAIMANNSGGFSPLWLELVAAPVALLSTSAIILLWRRQRSVLDLWLMVVMVVYLIEMPTSYYPDPNRYSPGWYAARLFGFLGSSLVLIVLLYEIQKLYARLVAAVLGQRHEREARLMTGDAVAAAVAHEVRQPLTAMIANGDAGLRFLNRTVPDLDRAKVAFKRIVDDGHRAGAVVGSIRAIFKRDLKSRVVLDVNELVQETLALQLGDLQRNRILVQADLTSELPQVHGDLVQLRQVLLNLITNAIDAMSAVEEPRILSVKSETHEGESVKVSVADTGAGIESQNAGQIFNPLYTTKADGMGMGLAICRSIVEAHDGRLWVAANAPRGAVFQFTLRGAGPTPLGT
ncbi:MAG TPA: MASE4 domain-containing protein [Candidatus Acidoferrum sp.]|nr:MASE4 domain-containing protein [Candidatus Acidoferrum sp.]